MNGRRIYHRRRFGYRFIKFIFIALVLFIIYSIVNRIKEGFDKKEKERIQKMNSN